MNTVDFLPNSTIPCMPLGDGKICTAHHVEQFLPPKPCNPHKISMFIKYE